MDYKQPHEGITGVDRRDSHLLSTHKRAVAHRDALIAITSHLHRATLVGHPAPVTAEVHDRIVKPEIGDLVVEMSALYGRDAAYRLKALGYFVEKRKEWAETDTEWAAHEARLRKDAEDIGVDWEPDGERSTDTAWYIQYGANPGAICRWTNCAFVVVPIDPGMCRRPVGTRDGNGVTITRDDLLGELARSGFDLR